MDATQLGSLVESWVLQLKAQRRSPQTIKGYLLGVQQYMLFCGTRGISPDLDKASVNAWVLYLLEQGKEASTVVLRQQSLRILSAWLTEEGEIPQNLLLGLKRPQVDKRVVNRLSEEDCKALIKACKGKEFRDLRDEAILRFMLETMVRAQETIDMTISGTHLKDNYAVILRGKGGKGRTVPFGPQTAAAIDKYLRMRRTHRLAKTDKLWLGAGGKTIGYVGLWSALKHRAELAGIENFHPHLTRHTGAQRWLDAGGSEGSLMSVAGWSNRNMLDRYTRATAASRAANEARSLNLGDF